MKIFVLFFAVLVYAQTEPKRDCGENAEWTSCGSSCSTTCYSLKRPLRPCAAVCVEGCFCKENFIRNYAGTCVPEEKCSSCPANTTYSDCGLSCQRTCDPQSIYRRPCTENCQVDGCNCNKGYVKDHDSGRCILESDCPKPEPKGDCGENAEWNSCGSLCPTTCYSLKRPLRPCAAVCVEGCFCKKNFVRNYAGICVRKEECSSCPANSTYSDCGLSCQRTCDPQPIYKRPCTEDCHVDGCNCNKGYVKDHYSGRCILESDCPIPGCPQNMTYTTCSNNCEGVCNREPMMCAAVCLEIDGGTCVCEGEYVRGPGGNCILPSDCPKVKNCH